ncbi:MAG: hypothetical protein R3C05_15865 [Pirellulaceae bacterium]
MLHRVLIGSLITLLTTSIVAAQTTTPAASSATATATQPKAQRESRLRAPDAKPTVEPLPVVVELLDDVRDLVGSLLDTNDLEVQTAFGIAKMPLKEVLGIRLARDEDEVTTVVLHNGDIITGSVSIENLLVQTSWGKSEVNGTNLGSIFFDQGLSWKSLKLLAGEKWTLEKAEELAPSPTTQASAQKPPVDRASRPTQSVLVKP